MSQIINTTDLYFIGGDGTDTDEAGDIWGATGTYIWRQQMVQSNDRFTVLNCRIITVTDNY